MTALIVRHNSDRPFGQHKRTTCGRGVEIVQVVGIRGVYVAKRKRTEIDMFWFDISGLDPTIVEEDGSVVNFLPVAEFMGGRDCIEIAGLKFSLESARGFMRPKTKDRTILENSKSVIGDMQYNTIDILRLFCTIISDTQTIIQITTCWADGIREFFAEIPTDELPRTFMTDDIESFKIIEYQAGAGTMWMLLSTIRDVMPIVLVEMDEFLETFPGSCAMLGISSILVFFDDAYTIEEIRTYIHYQSSSMYKVFLQPGFGRLTTLISKPSPRVPDCRQLTV